MTSNLSSTLNEVIKRGYKNNRIISYYFSKDYLIKCNLYKGIIEKTASFPIETSLTERIYCISKGILEPLKCTVCNKNKVSFISFKEGYSTTCSSGCTFRSTSFKQKRTKTLFEKYGVTNPGQSEVIREKVKKKNIELYGVEHYSQTQEYKDRTKKTLLEKYGVENMSQIEISKRYGSDNVSFRKEVQEKRRNNYLEKYGVDSYFKTSNFKEQLQYKYYLKHLQNLEGIVTHNIGFEEYKEKLYLGKYDFICKQCNTPFIDYLSYNGRPKCPICFPYVSSYGEKEVKEFLLNSFIFGNEIIENDRKVLSGKELDLYLPNYNLAIEYNGLMYHSFGISEHSRFFTDYNKNKVYHLEKTDICSSKGIELLHINENEWRDNKFQEIWKEHILFKLKKLDISEYSLEQVLKRKYYIKVENSTLVIDRRFSNGQELVDLGFKLKEIRHPEKYYFHINTLFQLETESQIGEKYKTEEEIFQNNYRVIYNSGYLVFTK